MLPKATVCEGRARMGTGTRHLRTTIARALDEGASLDEVEQEIIGELPVSEDTRDALWLYAWGETERRRDRELAAINN